SAGGQNHHHQRDEHVQEGVDVRGAAAGAEAREARRGRRGGEKLAATSDEQERGHAARDQERGADQGSEPPPIHQTSLRGGKRKAIGRRAKRANTARNRRAPPCSTARARSATVNAKTKLTPKLSAPMIAMPTAAGMRPWCSDSAPSEFAASARLPVES